MIPNPLAIFGELRTQFKSIKERYDKFKVGPEKFKSLTDKLDLVLSHLKDIELLLQAFPRALPSTGAAIFHDKLAHIRQTLKADDNESDAMPSKLTKAHGESSSTANARQFLRAKSLDAEMTALMDKIEKAENQLANLVGVLLISLKVDERGRSNHNAFMSMLRRVGERVTPRSETRANHDAVMSMLADVGERITPRTETRANQKAVMSTLHNMGERITPRIVSQANHEAVMSTLCEIGEYVTPRAETQANHEEVMTQLKNMAETSHEAYRSKSNTPDLDGKVVLDFSPETSLGKLAQSVLYGGSSETVTAATGATATTNLAYGVLGMTGVGKTVALQALGQHEEVKKKFRHGVLYMTFGRKATLKTAVDQIAKIMRLTGATTEVEDVRSSTSLRDVIDYAVMWFGGKICLYIMDDLWPAQDTSERPEQDLPKNYFELLRQLLRGSRSSRMVISTRCSAIADAADHKVDFGTLDPLGDLSSAIFMEYAGFPTPQSSSVFDHELRPSSFSGILSICGGLPIALSVTGSAVKKHVLQHGTFEKACDAYIVKLKERKALPGNKKTADGKSLNAEILLSLESLEDDFSDLVAEHSLEIDDKVADLYSSMCVLSNQAWIPVSVLGRMWKIDEDAAFDVAALFCEMSLAKPERHRPSSGSPEEPGIVLHDLFFDFCQQQAEAAEEKKPSFWHAQLLKGYWRTTSQPIAEDLNTQVANTIMCYKPRPWWSTAVPADGYIHTNLARHLSGAGQVVELAALLLDARWTELRARIGGILSLQSDFVHLGSYLSQWEGSEEVKICVQKIEESFEKIFKAVRLSWGRLPEGMRAFQFQVCGRLQSCREPNTIPDVFLRSVERTAPKPCLVPVSAFFTDLYSALMMEIPIRGKCASVACSPCGRYIAAGAGHDIVIAKVSTGEVLQRLRGHTNDVRYVKFAAGSKNIVSENLKYNCISSILMWEWESSPAPVRVFNENFRFRTSSTVQCNILRLFDVFLEEEDLRPGAQPRVLSEELGLICLGVCDIVLDICGKNRQIASRTGNGILVKDSVTKRVVFQDDKAHKSDVTCGAFSPNGRYFATGSMDDTIRLWDVATWARGESLRGHEDSVTCVAFSPDGTNIASSSDDGTIRLWDVESGQGVGISPKIPTWMTNVSFTPNGERIISGSNDGVVRVWDACLTRESEEQNFAHTGAVRAVAISENGLRVATASDDRTVRQWNAQTGEQIGMPLRGHRGVVIAVTFSPDARKLVSGSYDATLRLWDAEKCDPIGDPFEGHKNAIRCVSFSCDGLRIISGSLDFTIRLWNAGTQQQIGYIAEARTANLISCVSESIDGCHIVSRDVSGRTTIRNRDNMAIVWISERHNAWEDKFANRVMRKAGHPSSGVSEIVHKIKRHEVIVSRDASGITTIRDRDDNRVLWISERPNSIQDGEAEEIIRSCNQQTRRLWPRTFSAYTDELYCEERRVYSNLLLEKTMIADTRGCWTYSAKTKVFASGLDSGAVAICKFVIE